MMKRSKLFLLSTPDEKPPFKGDWQPVVIDVLRATSTIVTALAAGATSVRPVATVEEAISLGQQGFLAAGEREAVRPEGFTFGNSPLEFTAEAVKGARIALSTTNGTKALRIGSWYGNPYCVALLNLAVTVEALAASRENVLIICSGSEGAPCPDDTYVAGGLASMLAPFFAPDAAANKAIEIFQSQAPYHRSYLAATPHAKTLAGLGMEADVDFCAQENSHPILARWVDAEVVAITAKDAAASGTPRLKAAKAEG